MNLPTFFSAWISSLEDIMLNNAYRKLAFLIYLVSILTSLGYCADALKSSSDTPCYYVFNENNLKGLFYGKKDINDIIWVKFDDVISLFGYDKKSFLDMTKDESATAETTAIVKEKYKYDYLLNPKSIPISSVESLKGNDSFVIIIIGLDSEKDNDLAKGLLEYDLQTKIELKLRQSGIKVSKDSKSIILGVSFKFLRLNDEMYFVNANVEVMQRLRLNSDLNKLMALPTWETGNAMIYCNKNNPDNIWNVLSQQIDRFLNDFLSVNPKK